MLTSRNIGVPGGNNDGKRKLVSKLYARVGGLYTFVQHLYVPIAWRLIHRLTIEPL